MLSTGGRVYLQRALPASFELRYYLDSDDLQRPPRSGVNGEETLAWFNNTDELRAGRTPSVYRVLLLHRSLVEGLNIRAPSGFVIIEPFGRLRPADAAAGPHPALLLSLLHEGTGRGLWRDCARPLPRRRSRSKYSSTSDR